MSHDSTPITRLLNRMGNGERSATDELFALVYEEMRKKARALMSKERPDHTLQPTALVHEAYAKMIGGGEVTWESRQHFYNAAAQAMRRILMDSARRKSADKRGTGLQRVDLEGLDVAVSNESVDWEALDRAMKKLEKEDPRKHSVVMYRYFAGLNEEQIGQILKVSVKTVQRDWKVARMFLLGEMKRSHL